MPKILEIRVEGNDIWCKIENIHGEKSPIHLWTNEEAERYYHQARQSILDEIIEKFR